MAPTVALITGAGRGMGQMAAWRLAAAGANVAALDLNEAGLAETTGAHSRIRAYPVDVTDADAVEQIVQQVEADLGPIDRVMNAAGVARVGPLLDEGPAEILRVMQINYGGTVHVAAATLPRMLERGRGELVNFASLAGWIPQAKMGAYCASKAAVVAYTEALWMENKNQGVRFVCVCPTAVDTPMLPDFFANADKRKKARAITPESVLDEIERALAHDRLFAFPHVSSKALWRLRRYTPGLLRRGISSPRLDLIDAPGATTGS